jgi:hypothetical protein
MSDVGAVQAARPEPFVDWRAVFGGAVTAAGVSATLLAFGAAIGLAVASTAPTWRDSSPWLWALSGLFLTFVALTSFGLGGYAAGRMRHASRLPATKEIEFRDGMHGIFTWGLAILITTVLTLGGAAIGAQTMSGSARAAAGEGVIAAEVDELFRSERRAVPAGMAYRRSEAARILMKTSSNSGISAGDRDYLVGVVAANAGLPEEDAATRVDTVIARTGEALRRTRVAAVLQAFMIAAALLVGAAVAWFSAAEGGRDRERGTIAEWRWSLRRPATEGERRPVA